MHTFVQIKKKDKNVDHKFKKLKVSNIYPVKKQ